MDEGGGSRAAPKRSTTPVDCGGHWMTGQARIAATFACLTALAILAAAGCIEQQEPSAVVSVNRDSIEAGGELVVEVAAANASGSVIEARLGNEIKTMKCVEGECRASFSFTPAEGLYSLKVSIVERGGSREVERRRIEVNSKRPTGCLDGTLEGKCSGNLPFSCSGRVLVENCVMCGCPAGASCYSGKCAPEPSGFRSISVSFPEKAEAGKKFSVKASGMLVSGTAAGAGYRAELRIGGKTFAQDFDSAGAKAGDSLEFEIRGVSAEVGMHDVNLVVLGRGSGKVLGSYFAAGALHAYEEVEPPAAPTLTGAFAEGNDIVFEWTSVEGAESYALYRSSEANPAFIMYAKAREFNATETSGVIGNLPKGSHFFVITAIDAFGNESAYSNVKRVDVG